MNLKRLFQKYILKDIKFTIITIIALIIPFIFVEQFSRVMYMSLFDVLNGVIYIILYFTAPTFSVGIACFNLIRCFKRTEEIHQKLLNIAVTYIILIISFANIYYMEVCIGDFSNAITKYFEYNSFNKFHSLENERRKYISNNLKFDNESAFKGMKYRLWSGVDYETFGYKAPEEVVLTEDIINNANFDDKNFENNIKFIPNNRKSVYFECLYFSTISLATVGFGDISPNLWYSKITVMVEVVLGQILIIIVVGFFFSNSSNSERCKSKSIKQKYLTHTPQKDNT